MADITFHVAWGKSDLKLSRDAGELWRNLGVLDSDQIVERGKELCALAYAGDRLAAVSTAHFFDYPRLRSRFFYYRTTVDPGFRQQKLASRLCVYSRDSLAEWSRKNPEEKIKGLFIVLQAEEFRSRQYVPIYRRLGLNLALIGYTPGGHQMRVEWFNDATVE